MVLFSGIQLSRHIFHLRLMSPDLPVALLGGRAFLKVHPAQHRVFSVFFLDRQKCFLHPALPLAFFLFFLLFCFLFCVIGKQIKLFKCFLLFTLFRHFLIYHMTCRERHPADEKRILRALEVYLETGETITEHNRKTQAVPPRYSPIWLGLDFAQRGELYRRIDLRVSLMLQQGLVEEIRGLLADGIPEKATAMQAIGYKEFVDALDGRCTIEEAADLVRQSSRRYAKRQLTWFRRNKAIHWLIREAGDTGREILENARRIVSDFDN